MPRIECDKSLQVRLEQVIRDAGTPAAAAKQLGLERTMVWRFLKTGCAIPKNREALATALEVHESRQQKSATENVAVDPFVKFVDLSLEDVWRVRAFCQSMIAVLDCYEKSGLLAVPNKEVSTRVGVAK